ncbi:MAG: hypothetical protein PHU54_10025 [Candidatus Omnitrophica bacterium]|nr:hypothetical protein [Candidatus Omnitrophota bacterium]
MDKARVMWGEMNASERAGVRFGLFPAVKMRQAEETACYNGKELSQALMAVAEEAK